MKTKKLEFGSRIQFINQKVERLARWQAFFVFKTLNTKFNQDKVFPQLAPNTKTNVPEQATGCNYVH